MNVIKETNREKEEEEEEEKEGHKNTKSSLEIDQIQITDQTG